ncbi:MAG: radical SAM protein [Anaerolineaceae bacterium]|nr:radical SAM protein [Anaerolineaceae bacterium]
MKVTLISTEGDVWALGMRCVSATIKEAGHSTCLIFMETNKPAYPQKTLDELIELVKDTDIIGFSCLANGSERTKQVIKKLRPLNKMIVWGGVHASLTPEDCVDWADVVCLGEGEGFILELIERVEHGKEWWDIQNAAYKRDGKLICNTLRPLIANLDDLPLPDYWMEDEYHLESKGFSKVTMSPAVLERGEIAFNGSRGCAFFCTYCCNRKIKNLYSGIGNYVRRMSVPRLINHLETLKKIYPQGKYIYFIDEDFSARPLNELTLFAENLPEKVGLPFECMGHPARITQTKMDLLVKAGLWRIRIGVETGSERTKREIYDRHVSNESVLKATQVISSYPNIATQYFFIIANPYEERQDILDTIHLISSMAHGSNIWVFDLVFFPGSEIYNRAIKDNLFTSKQEGGFELDYREGFHYKQYEWKKKNLYLNGLLYHMEGICTASRLGSIPRFMLPLLINPKFIDFNEKVLIIAKTMILVKDLLQSFRHFVARTVRFFIKDPTAVYNTKTYLKKKVHSNAV